MNDNMKGSRTPAVAGVCYVACAIAAGGIIAVHEMTVAHSGGADPTPTWLAFCGIAALAGAISVVLLILRPPARRSDARIAFIATICGMLIFAVLAMILVNHGVPAGSHSTPLPRTGANA